LTNALLCQNGFSAYLDYLLSVSEDSAESLNLLCKVVLTRPAKFDSDLVSCFSPAISLFLGLFIKLPLKLRWFGFFSPSQWS
jgi:hypothetical protein